MQPDPNTEALADRISEAFGEPTLIPLEVKAVLWDINAESWERGVMFKGGVGTFAPPRPENPYRLPPLNLPTEPTWGIAVIGINHNRYLGQWYWDESREVFYGTGPNNAASDKRSADRVSLHDWVPLTDEQVARIEVAQ